MILDAFSTPARTADATRVTFALGSPPCTNHSTQPSAQRSAAVPALLPMRRMTNEIRSNGGWGPCAT